MPDFKLVSEYTPTGDQPQAIKTLSDGVLSGEKNQILLGVTGSGKTFTMRSFTANLKNFFPITLLNILSATMIIISRRHIYLKPIRL